MRFEEIAVSQFVVLLTNRRRAVMRLSHVAACSGAGNGQCLALAFTLRRSAYKGPTMIAGAAAIVILVLAAAVHVY